MDGAQGTPASPPLQLLPPEVAAPPARVGRIPVPSRFEVHLCMHDKEINIENAYRMQYVMMRS